MKNLINLFLILIPALHAAAQGEDLLPPPLEWQVMQETRINGQRSTQGKLMLHTN